MEAAEGATLGEQATLSYHHSSYTIYGGIILKDQVYRLEDYNIML